MGQQFNISCNQDTYIKSFQGLVRMYEMNPAAFRPTRLNFGAAAREYDTQKAIRRNELLLEFHGMAEAPRIDIAAQANFKWEYQIAMVSACLQNAQMIEAVAQSLFYEQQLKETGMGPFTLCTPLYCDPLQIIRDKSSPEDFKAFRNHVVEHLLAHYQLGN